MTDLKTFLLRTGGRSAVIPSRPSRFAVALRASLDRMPPPRQVLGKQIRRGVSAGAPIPTARREMIAYRKPSYLPPILRYRRTAFDFVSIPRFCAASCLFEFNGQQVCAWKTRENGRPTRIGNRPTTTTDLGVRAAMMPTCAMGEAGQGRAVHCPAHRQTDGARGLRGGVTRRQR